MSQSKVIESLIKLYHDLMDVEKYSGREAIFRPTSRAIIAIRELDIPKDEASFNNFIFNLYVLFYEGSGYSERLNSGCDNKKTIKKIKDLRNYYFHDLEHGKNAKEKFVNIGDIFENLIGNRFPVNEQDWITAGNLLVSELLDFSSQMLKYLTSNHGRATIGISRIEEFFEHDVVLFPGKKQKFRTTKIAEEFRDDSIIFLPTFYFSSPPKFGTSHSAIYLTSENSMADFEAFKDFILDIQRKWK